MSCERFESRLIDGVRPGDDVALAAHVGSCLRCFRTAGDMRDVPRLAALLREGEGSGEASFDPGARFWQKFPGDVATAWMRSRANPAADAQRAGGPLSPAAREPAGPTFPQRAAAWFRRPVPAALTGAACAVGLALLVMWPALQDREGRGFESASGALDLAVDEGAALGQAADDSMAELDLEGLATLRDQLDHALGPAEEVEADEATPLVSSDPAIVADDLEMLDETGLLALQERLGPPI